MKYSNKKSGMSEDDLKKSRVVGAVIMITAFLLFGAIILFSIFMTLEYYTTILK
jgi:hypothetical protein